jgi:hypothetical protein
VPSAYSDINIVHDAGFNVALQQALEWHRGAMVDDIYLSGPKLHVVLQPLHHILEAKKRLAGKIRSV